MASSFNDFAGGAIEITLIGSDLVGSSNSSSASGAYQCGTAVGVIHNTSFVLLSTYGVKLLWCVIRVFILLTFFFAGTNSSSGNLFRLYRRIVAALPLQKNVLQNHH